jgi:parvulin-like peptidyl-prolyl isomerase
MEVEMNMSKLFLLVLMVLVFAQFADVAAQTQVFVNVPEENIRVAPNGRKIGAVVENTEMIAIAEKDNWVQVQITGWIWKPSISTVKMTIKGDYRALHIMTKTRADAEAILKQINAGEDFRKLAATKSIAPSAAIGGDLGYFNKGDFNPVFESAIIALKIDEVSSIIEAGGNFNIFKRIK